MYIGDAGKIYFGLAQDISLYRLAAGLLGVDAIIDIVNSKRLRWYGPTDPFTAIDFWNYRDIYAHDTYYYSFRTANAAVNDLITRLTIQGHAAQGASLIRSYEPFQAAGYKSSDGTDGATGTITLATITTITVKNGLITAWS